MIYLDMDGTIADTYSIDGWLDRMLAHDASVFLDAKPANKSKVMELITFLDDDVTILTMLPECTLSGKAKEAYFSQVKKAKADWLAKHFPEFTKIEFVEYQQSKSTYWKEGDVLIDDSSSQIKEWPGLAIKADWALPLDTYLSRKK